MKGLITKGIGGFYYVRTDVGLIQTRGRGKFRKDGIVPTVGDWVDIEILEDGDGVVDAIHERKNLFHRPPIANVDTVVIVFAAAKPKPNFDLIDKFLIMAESKDVEAILCMNKADLAKDALLAEIRERYAESYTFLTTNAQTGEGLDALQKHLAGRTSALAGPSGVGKSTILNHLIPAASMETGGISKKTGRGKHTTRHVEIFDIPEGGLLFDTPGFTSFDIQEVTPEELASYYPEFAKYTEGCRFDDCRHIHEPDCLVLDALEKGLIPQKRYDSYVKIYQELVNQVRR